MSKILLATDVPFWLESKGSERRISSLIRFLQREGFRLHVFMAGDLIGRRMPQEIQAVFPDLEIHSAPAMDKGGVLENLRAFARKVIRLMARLTAKTPTGQSRKTSGLGRDPDEGAPKAPRLSDFESPGLRREFSSLCERIQPDVVLVEYVRLAFLVQGIRAALPNHSRLLIDTHDVMHLRYNRYREKGEPHGIEIDETEECEALHQFDAVLAIQPREAKIFRQLMPDQRVLTVGHSLNYAISEVEHSGEIRVGFMGGPDVANVRAVQHLFNSVWPELRRSVTVPLTARIYGKVCHTLKNESLPADAELIGFVADEDQPFRECDIFVNPVDIGGGLKIKNVEALCHGKPLVTTALGAEGLEDGAGHAFLVAADADGMAAALSRLIHNAREREALGHRAYDFAKERFSEKAAYGALLHYLDTVRDERADRESGIP